MLSFLLEFSGKPWLVSSSKSLPTTHCQLGLKLFTTWFWRLWLLNCLLCAKQHAVIHCSSIPAPCCGSYFLFDLASSTVPPWSQEGEESVSRARRPTAWLNEGRFKKKTQNMEYSSNLIINIFHIKVLFFKGLWRMDLLEEKVVGTKLLQNWSFWFPILILWYNFYKWLNDLGWFFWEQIIICPWTK